MPSLKKIFYKLKEFLKVLYKILLEPKSFEQRDRRQEFLLNIALITSSALLIALTAANLLNSLKNNAPASLAINTLELITLWFLIVYLLSRLGHYKIARYLLVFTFLAGSFYGSWKWGVSLPAVLLTYALIIGIASVVIGHRCGLIIAGLILIVQNFIGYREIKSGLLPEWKSEMVGLIDVNVYSILLICITIISWLARRDMENSLKRAEKSEKALLKHQEELEEIIEKRTKQLAEAQADKIGQLYRFAELGKLSSGLFHDLINPLSAIALNLEMTKDNQPAIISAKEETKRAVAAGRRMTVLIEAIQRQIDMNDLNIFFSIKKTLEEASLLFTHSAKKLNVEIEISSEEDVEIFANPIHLHQIITNLLANALDAYKEKTLSEEKPRKIEIKYFKENDSLILEFKDYAGGIDQEIVENIFKPFFTTKRKTGGLGLGLPTVKSLISRYLQGTIEVKVIPDQSTSFIIKIPISHEQRKPKALSQYTGIPKTPPK